MKIIALSDLHYRMNPEWDPAVEELAAQVNGMHADVLVIAGDVGCADGEGYAECLSLFRPFSGRRLVVPGNHDLWTRGEDSMDLYERMLPDLSAQAGFHMLDTGPCRAGDTAFVGSVGWYDYSFRDSALPAPMDWYEDKTYPGKLEWMDRRFVHLGLSDPAFAERLAHRLETHLRAVEDADRVAAVFHHIPFPELVTRRPGDKAWTFGNAFMGSACFGEILTRAPNVRLSLSGHSHVAGETARGSLKAVNLGSTYLKKEIAVFEL